MKNSNKIKATLEHNYTKEELEKELESLNEIIEDHHKEVRMFMGAIEDYQERLNYIAKQTDIIFRNGTNSDVSMLALSGIIKTIMHSKLSAKELKKYYGYDI